VEAGGIPYAARLHRVTHPFPGIKVLSTHTECQWFVLVTQLSVDSL
jgi:hypothetical protein